MHNKRLMKLAKQQSQRKQELYNNFHQTFISTINLYVRLAGSLYKRTFVCLVGANFLGELCKQSNGL